MLNINEIICDILQINAVEFQDLVAKGQRPVKAAIRLGADAKLAQLVATLKVAYTAEEISTVYANMSVLSCMTGQDVGPFYEKYSIACLYSNNFRTLVNTDNMVLSGASYGYHGQRVQELLQPYFKIGFDFIPLQDTTFVVSDLPKQVKEYYTQVTTYSLMFIKGLNTEITNIDLSLLYSSEELLTLETGHQCMVLRSGALVAFTLVKETFEDWFCDDVGITRKGSKLVVRESLVRMVTETREEMRSFMEFKPQGEDCFIPYIDNDFSSFSVEI